MRPRRTVALLIAFAAIGSVLVRAGQQGSSQTPSPFPLSNAVRERGSSITGAYDGWYKDADGSIRLLVGYFNRNTQQELDIPIGPNNRIEPGGPDQGQPTHFLTARQWGVFTIKLPKDFGTKKLTWTIVANGLTNTVTLHTKQEWLLEPFLDAASKNTPPVLKFQADGPSFTGPPTAIAASYSTTVGQPVTLTTWAHDEGPKVNVETTGGRGRGAAAGFSTLNLSWSKFRGPGSVTFSAASRSSTAPTAARGTDGCDVQRARRLHPQGQANDSSGDGGGGFQCCWTNAHVAVSVKAASK